MQGWVKLHRQLTENPLWFSEPFTRGQAWVDMLLLASHKDHFFYVRGNRIDVKRGQVAAAENTLADRWQWSRGKVRRFIKELEKMQKVVQQKSKIKTLITIKNYEKFQGDGTTDGTTDGHQTVQQTDTIKNVNNDNNHSMPSSAASATQGSTQGMRLKKYYEIMPREDFKKICTAVAQKKHIPPKIIEAEFEKFEKYWLSEALTEKKASKKDWKATFRIWMQNCRPDREPKKDNHDLAKRILEKAINHFEAHSIIDLNDERIRSHLPFLAILNKGYNSKDIIEVLNQITDNPPRDLIYSWGYISKYFS